MIDIKTLFTKILVTLNDKVSKRGDTMNGSLTIQGTSPEQWGGGSLVVATQNGTAKGNLSADQTGHFGLWDQIHNKWLIRTNADGRVVVNIVPASLYSTAFHPTNVGTSYYYVTISTINDYNCVAVVASVKNNTKVLIFPKITIGGDQHISVTHEGKYYKGGFTVDWTNKKVGVRCLYGDAGTDAYIHRVYGLY